MNKIVLFTSALLLSATGAMAAKNYQVTGPVTELTDSKIVIQKNTEKFEIVRDSKTKVPADVKVGSKVTAYYTITATEIEDKSPKAKEVKADAKDVKKEAKKESKSAPAVAPAAGH